MLLGQNEIYYAIGRFHLLKGSDYVHRVEAAGLEVVYMIDPILDELVVNELGERYGHHQLVCIETEELVLP